MRFVARSPSRARTPTSPTAGTDARHGSAEQVNLDLMGRPVAWSSITPPAGPTSPRSPRTPRSNDEEDDPRRTERAERREAREAAREARTADPTQPIGMNFRINACEQSLRDHTNELAAQRLLLQQLVEASKEDHKDKKKLEERLDVSFTQNNQKHADHDKRADIMTQTINALADNIAQKLDELS